MSKSSHTDADRRAFCLKNLRLYLDLIMDDNGANSSASADAQRAGWARQASFWAGLLAALPPTKGPTATSTARAASKPLPPRPQSTTRK